MPALPILPDYCELHCLTNFTFLRGAAHAEELVARAKALGYAALAITDECSFAGVVRAHVAAKAHGLKLIIGTEIQVDDGPKLVLLATNRESYGHISALITRARMRAVKGDYRVTLEDLEQNLDHCLVLLVPPPVISAAHASPLPDSPPHTACASEGAYEHARHMARRFPQRAWIAVELLRGADDAAHLAALQALSAHSGLPLVAAGDVHMHVRSRKPLQDTLTAIRLGACVQQAGHALHPNAERHLRTRLTLAQIHPPALLAETLRVAGLCDFHLDVLRYEYPDEIVPSGHTPASWLRELTERGLRERFPAGAAEKVRGLVEKELALIHELEYEPFFLTVHDIVQFARRASILCQGRGSAANSIVCYALGITAAGPDRLDMLFERFISRERKEPPDIDVDFEHQRREEVIQYLYQKYGRHRAAIAATLIRYRRRSAIRDVGKALGIESALIDRLAKSLAWWDNRSMLAQRLREAGLDPDSAIVSRWIELTQTLIGFPRHLSQHVGGFVISRGPLARLVPIENAAMPERSIIQWDKDDLESLGLIKVDVLALGMLSAIRRALDMIGRQRGAPLTMQEILAHDDPAVYTMIQKADTIGVFQIESRAQMTMLPRLKPERFYDLVIEVAIVRPGPIQGGMVHPYLRRRQGLEPVTYPSEAIRAVLERTLGVPIFQEQVMQIAIVAAGFTPGQADELRRAMGAWQRKGTLENYQAMLSAGMRKNHYSDEFIDRICKQIQGFGEYGFPESHSASFALLAYVSAWLKHYEPAAFLAALLNSQPMGFYSPSQLVQDARRHGVTVLPVDVTASDWECTLPAPNTVRLGLHMVSGLAHAAGLRIVTARNTQVFVFIEDFKIRAQLNTRDLKLLADAGALATLAGHRRNAHWLAAGVQTTSPLLQHAPIIESAPQLAPPTEGQNIAADYASVGLTLGRHPLALLRPRLQRMKHVTAAQLMQLADGDTVRAAGIVTCRQRPGTASGVVFVTLEDETGYVNVVVWNTLVEKQRRELLGARLMGVEGKLQREGEVIHLIARRLTDHTRLLGALTTESRDFH
jgi:error-prone DNA polymerase